jgi:hypothetical protein
VALPVIVVEDDPFTRLIPLVLDPNASEERRKAFADFMSTDEPDFAGWCAGVRAGAGKLHPADVRMVTTEDEMRAQLKDAVALVVESFRVGRNELAAAPHLKVLQKFGTVCATSIPRPASRKASSCARYDGEPTSPAPSTPSASSSCWLAASTN